MKTTISSLKNSVLSLENDLANFRLKLDLLSDSLQYGTKLKICNFPLAVNKRISLLNQVYFWLRRTFRVYRLHRTDLTAVVNSGCCQSRKRKSTTVICQFTRSYLVDQFCALAPTVLRNNSNRCWISRYFTRDTVQQINRTVRLARSKFKFVKVNWLCNPPTVLVGDSASSCKPYSESYTVMVQRKLGNFEIAQKNLKTASQLSGSKPVENLHMSTDVKSSDNKFTLIMKPKQSLSTFTWASEYFPNSLNSTDENDKGSKRSSKITTSTPIHSYMPKTCTYKEPLLSLKDSFRSISCDSPASGEALSSFSNRFDEGNDISFCTPVSDSQIRKLSKLVPKLPMEKRIEVIKILRRNEPKQVLPSKREVVVDFRSLNQSTLREINRVVNGLK